MNPFLRSRLEGPEAPIWRPFLLEVISKVRQEVLFISLVPHTLIRVLMEPGSFLVLAHCRQAGLLEIYELRLRLHFRRLCDNIWKQMFALRWSRNRRHKAKKKKKKKSKSQSPRGGAGVVRALVRPRALGWGERAGHI